MGNSKGRNKNPNRNRLHPERERRQIEAEARQNVRNRMTPEEQLKHLDAALGEGIGARRERARLLQAITKSAASPTAVAVPKVVGSPVKKPKKQFSKRTQKPRDAQA